MTEHIIRVADFAAARPKAWRTVRAAAMMPELGHSELAAFLRVSKRTVLRHLDLFRVRTTDGDVPGVTGPGLPGNKTEVESA